MAETRLSDWDRKLLAEVANRLVGIELTPGLPNGIERELKNCREYLKEIVRCSPISKDEYRSKYL